MISIVTASYNYEQYIGETIQSVLNQTFSEWEMIIVDDCSTDKSVNVIKSFNDKRIKLFQNEKNLGLAKTLKKGIELAKGDWIVFLESDDMIFPEYLEKKLEIIRKYPDISLVFNDCEFFGDEDKINELSEKLFKIRKVLKSQTYPKNMFYNFYLGNKIFTFSSVMAKRDELMKLDFNPIEDCLLDWCLWLQMAYNGSFYYMPEILTKWRIHFGSYISKSKKDIHASLKIYFNIFKRFKNPLILLFIPFAQAVRYLRGVQKLFQSLI